jgi:hypothetical protein
MIIILMGAYPFWTQDLHDSLMVEDHRIGIGYFCPDLVLVPSEGRIEKETLLFD